MTAKSLSFYSSAWRGGSGWFVQALTQALCEAGCQTTLIAPVAEPVERQPHHADLRHMEVPQGAAGKGSKPYRAARALYRILWTFPAFLRARLRSRNFLVTHFDWLQVAVFQFAWIRLLGGRLTFIVHDATPHAWAFPERFRKVEKAMLQFTYDAPQHLVTLTELARQELIRDYGIAPEKVTVIPHGAFTSGTPSVLPGNGEVLIFGMLRRNKRILESLEAMRLLPAETSVRMVVAGAPHAEDPDYWKACEPVADTLGDRLRKEIGFVPEARVDELLAECDAVLLPYEEFNSQSGVAILAAFADRLLICTNVGGIGELITAGLEPILVEHPVTDASIAAALVRFEATPVEERRTMASRSREKLSSYLSWDRIAREYLKIIDG